MEVMEYWSLNDIYIYNCNLYYEGVYEKLISDRQKQLAELDAKSS